MNRCAKCTDEHADTFVRGQWLCPVCLAGDADYWHSYALTVEAVRDHWKQRAEAAEQLAVAVTTRYSSDDVWRMTNRTDCLLCLTHPLPNSICFAIAQWDPCLMGGAAWVLLDESRTVITYCASLEKVAWFVPLDELLP